MSERIQPMIQVQNLFYTYAHNNTQAIKDISFSIARGETFALLGPSGAGKSTTQGILTGLLPLQKGSGQVAGFELGKITRQLFNKVGVSFEQSNVYDKLTARENLTFYRKLFDVPTVEPMELLKMAGLDHVADKRAGTYSKGMKHRLTFVRSMLNNPELWFLDEPTTGLDPAIASQIKDIIQAKKDAGVTILLTTHNMMLADQLSDRIGFIVDGELKLVDTPRNLKLKYGQKLVSVEYKQNGTTQTDTLSLIDETEKQKLHQILNEYEIETMHTREATLEEIFIKVTGRGLV
ncbi:MAG: ABC transporter ATP-binding protein [Bacillota bacterium]|nr:ABC transporter ATP-binding protein [Bacillota bacterium]